jgi:hypothetical protein
MARIGIIPAPAPAAAALDADLTAIAALEPANNDFIQRKAGAWTSRTPAQVLTDLGVSGPTYLSSFKWGVD